MSGRWAQSSASRPIEIPHLPPIAPRQTQDEAHAAHTGLGAAKRSRRGNGRSSRA